MVVEVVYMTGSLDRMVVAIVGKVGVENIARHCKQDTGMVAVDMVVV